MSIKEFHNKCLENNFNKILAESVLNLGKDGHAGIGEIQNMKQTRPEKNLPRHRAAKTLGTSAERCKQKQAADKGGPARITAHFSTK